MRAREGCPANNECAGLLACWGCTLTYGSMSMYGFDVWASGLSIVNKGVYKYEEAHDSSPIQ